MLKHGGRGNKKRRNKITLHCTTQVSSLTLISIALNFSTLFIPETNMQWGIAIGGAVITYFASHHTGKRCKWF